jgi:hypothetical protein
MYMFSMRKSVYVSAVFIGSSYPLLGSYLPGTVPSTEHLKSLLPEEYWAAHGIDGMSV